MGCAAGQGIALYASRHRLRAWRRVRRRDAQLDWEFDFYASRRQRRAWPGGGGGQGRSWTGNSLCSPLAADFGPGPEERRRGAQLGWEFAFYASRRRRRARPGGGGRTGSVLSTPPAVDFGPGSERAAAGCAAASGDLSFYASRRRLWAWPGGGRRRGAQLDGEFAVYASRRRLRASPGGGGGGARCLGPEFAFLSFTHRPLDARPSYARSLVPTPSKTVDQTLPPRWDGEGRRLYGVRHVAPEHP